MAQPSDSVSPDLFSSLRGTAFTYEHLYQAFTAYCAGFSQPLNLCGLSLGAVLALNFALEHPEKVNTLVLAGAQYKMPKRLLQLQNMIFRLMPSASFQKMGFEKNDLIRLTKSMQSLDFSEGLKKISCQTLILCGERDSANKKASIQLSKSITGAEIQFVESAGHEINVDAPEKLAEILDQFGSMCIY